MTVQMISGAQIRQLEGHEIDTVGGADSWADAYNQAFTWMLHQPDLWQLDGGEWNSNNDWLVAVDEIHHIVYLTECSG